MMFFFETFLSSQHLTSSAQHLTLPAVDDSDALGLANLETSVF